MEWGDYALLTIIKIGAQFLRLLCLYSGGPADRVQTQETLGKGGLATGEGYGILLTPPRFRRLVQGFWGNAERRG